MSDEGIPSTAEMRKAFGEYTEQVFRAWNPGQPDPPEGFTAGFDGWLAARDLEMATRLAAAWTVGGVPLPAKEQEVIVEWILERARIRDAEWR